MKKKLSIALAAFMLCSTLSLTACGADDDTLVLRVGSWDEYIDEGGEDSYAEDADALYEEFAEWYFDEYGKKVRVEYVALQDNETMYTKIKLGDNYDLLCPSEYMMMKLVAENKLETYPESFFDKSQEHNYYAKYVSPYIDNGVDGIFNVGKTADGKSWRDYTAGYMWGTTGFVINPKRVTAEAASSWSIFKNPDFSGKITAKDNVRDAYFVGLGMYYENNLLDLQSALGSSPTQAQMLEYQAELKRMMNDTSTQTVNGVYGELEQMRKNLYGLETDEGKMDIITEKFDISYQWSGDAVYVLDKAEDFDLSLQYVIPQAASNLWFDGWVMLKGISEEKKEAAMAFVNFLSRPDNVIRNMYYIGYTSCISGNQDNKEIFEYICSPDMYGVEEDESDFDYDVSYFFGDNHIIPTTIDQTSRQLFAQYPDKKTISRLVVMDYFPTEVNADINRMWIVLK